MPIKIALILSVLLQFTTAIIAISLIKRTLSNIAWWLISFGFLLMAFRRLLELLQVIESNSKLITGLLSSWTGVIISLIMLISLIFIKSIFNIQQRIDKFRRQNESRILSAIIKTEETERQYFAKELHDGLGPLLSSVKMAFSALTKNMNTKNDKKIVSNTENLIDESIIALKEISNKLSPHVLNNFGLYKAVKLFVNKLEINNQPKIIFNSNLEDKRFQYNIEAVFYRVICELIANTIKHASALNINIDLFADKNKLTLDYYDDGVGFILKKIQAEKKGTGYSNIESRIRSLNGIFQIYTNPNEGVNINISVNVE